MEILTFIGRFHPLVLHLPIGALVVAFLMEVLSRRPKYESLQGGLPLVLLFSAVSAVMAAVMGYLLSLEGGYDDQLLAWHQWSGVALAVFATLLYWTARKESKFYFPTFLCTMALLTVAGHFGGSLTHGSDYLTSGLSGGSTYGISEEVLEAELKALPHPDSAMVFRHLIQPILQDKCVGCHRPGKAKGALLLHDASGITKGGENGAVFTATQPDESLLIERINLPLDQEEHMPPRGKKQLEKEEKALLTWWIEQGGNFDKTLGTCEVPKPLGAVIENRLTVPEGVWALDIKPLKGNRLQQIRAAGLPIVPLSQSSPFLEIDLSGADSLTAGSLRPLRKASEQLIRVNLAGAALDDGMLSVIGDLPHLVYLNLSNTAIGDKALKHLKDLEYLEYLNLYGTSVTDKGMESLKLLPALKQLYLWQTEVTKAGAQALLQEMPELYLDMGMEQDTTFKSVQLKPPQIVTENELFEDSVTVTLDLNFKGADIFYTLDGTEPDSTTQRYEEPLVLKNTQLLRAIAQKTGWQASEVVEKQFVRVRYKPVAVQLENPPSSKYAANGPASLMDFRKGSERFQDGLWMGWEKQHAVATIDLGSVKPVSNVTVGTLENVQAWIFFPKGLKVWTSADGRQFTKVLDTAYPVPDAPTDPSTKNITESFDEVQARYVKVMVESKLTNPDWHPEPGGGSWVFVDEILVQ